MTDENAGQIAPVQIINAFIYILEELYFYPLKQAKSTVLQNKSKSIEIPWRHGMAGFSTKENENP